MTPGVTVYWRPGCPYCTRLLGDLDRIGLPIHLVNIWEDPAAAGNVRSIAGGNETVPTVVVGDAAMVNPRAADVLDAARQHAPDLVAGLDDRTLAPWWAGLAVTLLLAVGWFAVATSDPANTYHFAPALIAAAWPVAGRLCAGRRLPPVAAAASAAGATVIAAAATLLAARDALAGPTLFGIPTALTEALIGIAVGAVAGTGLAVAGRRRHM